MGPELSLAEALLRLLLVTVLAGAVGVERELRDHEAGLRTHMLVGVGAALFVITGNYAWGALPFGSAEGIVLDPSRVVAYVVTGVGFLGAGAILKNGGSIRGLTTAASLWVVAAIGVTVGSGLYVLGIFGTAIVLLSLWPVKRLAHELGVRSRRAARIEVELDADGRLSDVIEAIEASGRRVLQIHASGEAESRLVAITVASGDAASGLDGVLRLPSVRSVSAA
jgi:putative Mg2+ transporter-C (MgtC) family protein